MTVEVHLARWQLPKVFSGPLQTPIAYLTATSVSSTHPLDTVVAAPRNMSSRANTYRSTAPAAKAGTRYTPYQGREYPRLDKLNNMADYDRHLRSAARGRDDRDHLAPRMPRLYDPAIDRLAGRTIRAYFLVIDYDRACPDGHRWTTEHIELIRHAGKDLDSDCAALRKMRAALERGDDAVSVSKIRMEADYFRAYCQEIQDLIKMYEQVPVMHMQPVEVDKNGRSLTTSAQDNSIGYDEAEVQQYPITDYDVAEDQQDYTYGVKQETVQPGSDW